MNHNPNNRPLNASLKILQWNCHSIVNKIDISYPLFSNFDILILSETWLNVKNQIHIRDFTILRADSHVNKSGGLLIALRNSIQYSLLKDTPGIDNKFESMGVIIHLNDFDLAIISIYRHPTESLSLLEYSSLFNFCNSYTNSILLGDFNAHHIEWGCTRSCREGTSLLAASLENSFTCINEGLPSFLTRPGQRTSAIDLAFVSPPLLYISEWKVLSDNYLSDHFSIDISLNLIIPKRIFFTHKIKLNKLEKEEFIDKLSSCLTTLNETISNVDLTPINKYDIFIDHLKHQLPVVLRPKLASPKKLVNLPSWISPPSCLTHLTSQGIGSLSLPLGGTKLVRKRLI